jgi:hypothetical protein
VPRTLTVRLFSCASQSASGVLAAAAYGREARGMCSCLSPVAGGTSVYEVMPHKALDDGRRAHESCAICRAVSALRSLRSLSRSAAPPRWLIRVVTGRARHIGSETLGSGGRQQGLVCLPRPLFPGWHAGVRREMS